MPRRKQSGYIHVLGLAVLFLLILSRNAGADTVYLKNGNAMKGIITGEDESEIEIQVCAGGSVKLERNSIRKIERSDAKNQALMRRKWENEQNEFEERLKKQRMIDKQKPKPIKFSEENRNIVVSVLLNNKVKVSLVLDTGSSVVMLTKDVAEELGLNLHNAKADTKVSVVDGRKLQAKRVILKSVKLQDMEATDVEAAVLLEDTPDQAVQGGLLGMSFLSRFIFKIDHKQKNLILEKLK